jgi:hypothetical protein
MAGPSSFHYAEVSAALREYWAPDNDFPGSSLRYEDLRPPEKRRVNFAAKFWTPDNEFLGSPLRYERLSEYEVCRTYG